MQAKQLFEIARNAEREAVFAVASEHIANAKVGMPVKVSLQGRPEIAVTGSMCSSITTSSPRR